MKIINLQYDGVSPNVVTVARKNVFVPGSQKVSTTSTEGKRILDDLLTGDADPTFPWALRKTGYPTSFDDAVIGKAKDRPNTNMSAKNGHKLRDIWSDWVIVKFVKNFYTNLRLAMPFLMSYRYHYGLS